MARLTAEQIATYAQRAGFPAKEINTAVGIAMAESGGNTDAHNAKPPDDSYGLWQINMLGNLGPGRRKAFGITKNEQLFDPSTNAKAAYIVWKGSGWNAWTTYTSGKYKGGITNPNGAAAIDAGKVADAATSPIDGIRSAINAFSETLFKGAANTAGIGIAIALLVLGIILLARNQITSLIPAGKAAKIAKGVLAK